MTSFAFILGVAPLVVASGAGASARVSIGITVFSGMIASTCLAVLFVPAFFVIVQRFEEWLAVAQAGEGGRGGAGGIGQGHQMELGLAGKVALVTGSSRGIGRGIAVTLAGEGCDIFLTGTDETMLKSATAEIEALGRKAKSLALDLRKPEAPAAPDRAGQEPPSDGSTSWSTMPAPPSAAISSSSPTPTGRTAMR